MTQAVERIYSTKRQMVVVGMLMIMCALNYADRAAASVCVPLISKEYGLTSGQIGVLLSASLWAYILLNLPSALLMDRVGSKITGALSVTLWSLAMVLGAVAPAYSVLFVSRILLGVGEAPTFPLGSKAVNEEVTPRWQPFAFTLFMSSMQFGLFLGTTLTGVLTALYGWRYSLAVFGAFGIAWSIVWWIIGDEKRTRMAAPTVAVRGLEKIDFRRLLQAPTFIGVIITTCAGNYTNFLLVSWLPPYMHGAMNLTIRETGLYSGLAYLAAGIISVIMTAILQRLTRKTTKVIRVYCRIVSVCYALAALCMATLALQSALWPTIITVGLAFGILRTTSGFSQAILSRSLEQKSRIGSVYGTCLTFSNTVGLLAPIITGYTVEYTGSFNSAFLLSAFILVVGAISGMLLLGRGAFSIAPQPRDVLNAVSSVSS